MHELQGVTAEDELLPVGDGADVLRDTVERTEHLPRLRCAKKRALALQPRQRPDGAGVVGLHVVDNDVVYLGQRHDRVDALEVLVGLESLCKVDEDVLLVPDEVGVVGHPRLRHGPDPLEQIGGPVVQPDPEDVWTNF